LRPCSGANPVAVPKMDERAFWTLIAEARAIRETDAEVVATIEASLATLEPAEIGRFLRILCRRLDRSYHWDLMGGRLRGARAAATMNSTT